MTVRVLAFDPGGTTGFCIIEIQDDGLDFKVTHCDEIEWDYRLENIYDVFFHNVNPSVHIVVESFRLFPHKAKVQIGSQFPSSQVIGIIEAMHYQAMVNRPVEYQQPGDIARVAVENRDVNWVAGSPHKIDAYRHARLYFIKHFKINPFVVRT